MISICGRGAVRPIRQGPTGLRTRRGAFEVVVVVVILVIVVFIVVLTESVLHSIPRRIHSVVSGGGDKAIDAPLRLAVGVRGTGIGTGLGTGADWARLAGMGLVMVGDGWLLIAGR
ncbi:hypothetical protein F5Y14DRAFT_287256 [Nemania sp. NC0429]|nr:hypothetical protein F5Y14DRAFT_287256 [Nemania sp. NC0429]